MSHSFFSAALWPATIQLVVSLFSLFILSVYDSSSTSFFFAEDLFFARVTLRDRSRFSAHDISSSLCIFGSPVVLFLFLLTFVNMFVFFKHHRCIDISVEEEDGGDKRPKNTPDSDDSNGMIWSSPSLINDFYVNPIDRGTATTTSTCRCRTFMRQFEMFCADNFLGWAARIPLPENTRDLFSF